MVPKCKECESLRVAKASIFADEIRVISLDKDTPICRQNERTILPNEFEASPKWCPKRKAGDPNGI